MANSQILKQKEALVNEAKERINGSKVVVAFDYHGLTVESFETLRKSVRKAGGEVVVLKNNISRRAAEANGYNEFALKLVGPKAILFSEKNIVEPAKALYDFTKDNKSVEIAGGIVEGAVVEGSKIAELATLPSYETLLTQLAAGMLGTVSQLAIGLQQIVEQREANN
jgi:large subunit ribosomal protein L10